MAGSILVLEEYFQSGSSVFLEDLRHFRSAPLLRSFAPRWYDDARPWAREQLRAYLDLPLDAQGHEPLVKKLFKLAEAAQDDATLARFLVALDRSVRRDKRMRNRRRRGLFSIHTRNYLRRRAWRYFRRLGHRDPKRYLAAISQALPLYRDEDCDSGVHVLDNWGLVHILFHHAPILRNRTNGWFVRDGQVLRDLKPAPALPEVWKSAADEAFTILASARARAVRRSMIAMLKSVAVKPSIDRILALLEHSDGEVQALGADLLRSAAGLESLTAAQWLRLLENRNLSVLESICDILKQVAALEKFSPDQLLRFAVSAVGPIARIGLEGLMTRTVHAERLLELAAVRAPSLAADAVAFARERMTADPRFTPDWILAFLDSPTREAREAAWSWFAEEWRASRRVDLWAKLVESPYDDIRIAIVRHLHRFSQADQALRVLLVRAPMETVWATVLLNIHRGSRAKRMAAAQIAERIEHQPERAAQLLPLLAVASRSIRAPEFRAGLASLVRTAVRQPVVRQAIDKFFPELKLVP